MNFSAALDRLKLGKQMARSGWNGKNMYIQIQRPDAGSMNTLPYVFMKTACGNRVPWLASNTDLLGDDWGVVGE